MIGILNSQSYLNFWRDYVRWKSGENDCVAEACQKTIAKKRTEKIAGVTMESFTFTKAFAKFGATLRNPRWAYSAIASDGSMVLSCWKHMLVSQPDNSYIYDVNFSNWTKNPLGRDLLIDHVQQAFVGRLAVRLVVAETVQRAPVVAGKDCSKLAKTFRPLDNLVGEVVTLTGERFVIRFRKVKRGQFDQQQA